MKVICTTSNKYLHLIPVFTYLFNKYFDSEQEVTILGYDAPKCKLPDNFWFRSMGKQGDVSEWSTDLRRYFERMPDEWFVWLMDDTFIKRASTQIGPPPSFMGIKIGRYDLTNDVQKRDHFVRGELVIAGLHTKYRLSTQPSMWNMEFLLKYLTPGMTPWQFETQDPVNDGWDILGLLHPPIKHNEGVRKWNPHELDLNGFSDEDVKHIKTLL